MPHICRISYPLELILAASLGFALGCSQEAPSPTEPEAAPAVASTSTARLSFYQVSPGGFHTCGVTTDNRVYCWGYNASGQLGDGTTTDHLAPVAVATTLRFREVSTGTYHTCGVTMEYRAYCWGANSIGQLGDGTTINRLRPVAIAGGRQFLHVEMSSYHTCGVGYIDNRAFCWGYNIWGQLGDGTTLNRLTPVPVAATLHFRQVSAGGFHTCGVTTDNRAFCWGRNLEGEIGDRSEVRRRLSPTLVADGHQFHQLDAGGGHTCGVTTGKRAFCWGDGTSGQIGNGRAYLSFWPRAVAGGLYFDRVSAGGAHTCGETTLNRAYCWGASRWGQLGDGTGDGGTNTMSLTPVAVAGGLFFSQVSAGVTHTCGRTAAAVAYCWGANSLGQLGEGTTTMRSRPVRVIGPR